jgi:hypothetical protein
MANTLRIKRRPSSGSTGAPSSLYNGELAFNEKDNILYYGYGSGVGGVATSFPSIGGSGAYTLLGGTNATGTWPIEITGNAGTVTSGVYTSRNLSAGSGLVGGGDLSANRTFNIGQGDGISVSADSIAVDSSVARTTGGIANHIAYWNSSSGIIADSGQLYWDATNDRLGIGTSSPSGSLDVSGDATFRGDSQSITNVINAQSDYSGPHGIIKWYNSYDNIGDIASIQVYTDNSAIEGVLSFSTRNNSSPTEKMRILANGNVGIGTISPTEKLYVDGKGLFSSGVNISNQTASTIASFDSNKNVVSLSTGTYPSLTELSYVKDVTSAIQTQIDGKTTTSRTLTAGSGLVGGGTLAADRTFDIGQGDGISVSADSIAVDSTVIRTTGTQNVNGVKTFGNTTYFNSGIVSSGTNNIQAASTGSTATQFAVFTSSPNSSAQTVYTRTPSEAKTDIGLNNVTNDAQVKKIASTTVGYIPTWAVTTGDQLATGYSVETTLTGGSTAIARADAVKTYIDNLLGANDAMIFKGTIGTGGTVTALPTTYSAGWTYRVITAGTYAGIVCEIGDLIIAVIDRSGSGNLNSDWTVAQTNIDGAVINTRTLTAGSGLTGGGDLSQDRTFNIGAGDGITVNADDVAVDNTVVRTTGTQNITGNKNFSGTIVSSGTLSLKIPTTASTATQFPVFTSDPSSTAQTVSTRTPSQVKTDIGLSNVENTALSTWAGSTNITTLGTIGTGTWNATTIAANKGGTGQSSYTIGDLLYADTSSTLAKLADVATGNVLLAGGVATAPSWGKVNLNSGTHVSGILPINNGGTGQSSYTDGQLLIGNSTGNTLSKATLTEGTGLDITNGAGSITIAHEDTSTLTGAQGSNGIASITVDGMGHVTSVTTATYLTSATVCAAIADCTLDGGTF